MAERLIEDDGDRVGQIETAVEASRHGDEPELRLVARVEFRRQSGGFPAEDQIVVLGICRFPVALCPVGGKEKKPLRLTVLFEELLPLVDGRDITGDRLVKGSISFSIIYN